MSRFKIEVYTSSNPDLTFTVEAKDMPTREHLQNAILTKCHPEWDMFADIRDAMDYDFDLQNERSDLRNHDDERVWVIECYPDTDSDTDNPAYMIRVEPKT